MARTYKKPSFTSGKSITDLMSMDLDDFLKLDTKQLKEVTSRLASAGNKRIRNLEKGNNSPALRSVHKSGGNFSVKGKDLNSLRSEYVRAKLFLEAETSTVKGWNKVKQRSIDEMEKVSGVKITKEQFDDYWKMYEKLKEANRSVGERQFKYTTLDKLADMMNNTKKTPDVIVETIAKQLNKIYQEQEQKLNAGDKGVSGYFPID